MSLRALAAVEALAQQAAAEISKAKRDADIHDEAGGRVRKVTGFEPTFLNEHTYSIKQWAGDGQVPVAKLGIRFQVDDVVLVVTSEDGRSWSSVYLEGECPTCSALTISAGGFYDGTMRGTPPEEVQAYFIKRLAEKISKSVLCGNCAAREANACCPRCRRPWDLV